MPQKKYFYCLFSLSFTPLIPKFICWKMHFNKKYTKTNVKLSKKTFINRRLWPTYASAHNNLGTLVNNLDVAENHFLSAILYASTHINAHFNLGQLYM